MPILSPINQYSKKDKKKGDSVLLRTEPPPYLYVKGVLTLYD